MYAYSPLTFQSAPTLSNSLRRLCSEVKNSSDNPNSDFDDLPPSGLSDFDTGIAPGNQEDVHLNDLLDDIVSNEHILTVHRSLVKTDLINHFKDPSVMKSSLVFKIIDERGNLEHGTGIGVSREVYTLFWKEFSNSVTVGEREQVPFVRHHHFADEWEAVGRILVKGFFPTSYYPIFLSKAFICCCLFGNPIPDKILLDSFQKYLSPSEEEMVESLLKSNGLDSSKYLQFLRYTTGMDDMKKGMTIEVTYMKIEGLSSRPVAHTCGTPLGNPIHLF